MTAGGGRLLLPAKTAGAASDSHGIYKSKGAPYRTHAAASVDFLDFRPVQPHPPGTAFSSGGRAQGKGFPVLGLPSEKLRPAVAGFGTDRALYLR